MAPSGRMDRGRRHRPLSDRRPGRRARGARRAGGGRDPGASEPGGPLPRTPGGAMNATWTIAALTIKEAIRRRLLIAFVVITAVIVGLSAWGFDRLSHTHSLTSCERNVAGSNALTLLTL